MAGYNFRSVGSAISDELAKIMSEREAMKRQEMLDRIMQDREMRLGKNADAQTEVDKENAASLKAARESKALLDAETLRDKKVEMAGKMYQPGQVVDPVGQANVPGEMLRDQMTLPATSITAPKSIEQTQTPTGQKTFTGTTEQQQREAFLSSEAPQVAKLAILAGINPTAEMLTGPKTQSVFSVAPNRQSILKFDEATGQFKLHTGAVPKDAHWLQQNQPEGSDRPYFIPVTTGDGIKILNTRAGSFNNDTTQTLRPGATAESDLVRGGSMLYTMDRLSKQFNENWVGPIAGRYNTMQLALLGEAGQEGLASMSSTLANLQNTIINLRTGAQMSEPEAQRILNEIPGMNQPPDVFIAKLNATRQYFEDWYRRRDALAYGRPEQLPPVPGLTPNDTTTETPEQHRARLRKAAGL